MFNVKNTLIASLLPLLLTGCIFVDGSYDSEGKRWRSQQRENRQIINNLNMELGTIMARLGSPDFSEAFARGDDKYRILYYRTHRLRSDGQTTRDETTPLIFKNGYLIGWGDETLFSVHRK